MKNLLFALIALATVACSNDEPQKKGFETNEDIYNVTTSWEGVLDNTAHSLQLSFQATSSWEAAVQDEAKSWLSVTPTSGASGLNKVLVSVKSNPTTEDRAGSLSIIPLIGEPYVVTVSQKKDPEAEEQDYTSFVFYQDEDVYLNNCVAGYFDEDGYCWSLGDLGDISKGEYSNEIVVTDSSIRSVYFFTDYAGTRMFKKEFKLIQNVKNVFYLTADIRGEEVDKNNPMKYPQEKGAQ